MAQSDGCCPLVNVPVVARIRDKVQESPTIVTLRLQLENADQHQAYSFDPGQFNMVYLYGVGEVPISIVSDPEDEAMLDHTIRSVGRVTRGITQLKVGDAVGLRGPFGRGWPLTEAAGKDVLIVTGGLGCAPVVSVINYVLRRREQYGRLIIMQGVKHADDLIWRQRYEQWMREKDVEVLIAADVGDKNWPWHVGQVTQLCDLISIDRENTVAMMCGPEPMILASVDCMVHHGLPESAIWISMERSMHCGVGLCGHCQLGDKFLCREGPVFNFPDIKHWVSTRGI
jgi:sulfhydrogenase subunit gamma (sulfur reductase)